MKLPSTHQIILSAASRVWGKIQPSGTLENWLPYHPLSAMEEYPFEQGLFLGYEKILKTANHSIFLEINRLCMQWLPLFFDTKQASWSMPGRTKNLYRSILNVYCYQAHDIKKITEALSLEPLELIEKTLESLEVDGCDYELFFEYLLNSLPGWAAFVCYNSSKNEGQNWQLEYLALRCCLAWEYQLNTQQFLRKEPAPDERNLSFHHIIQAENTISQSLCEALSDLEKRQPSKKSDAHFVFCMDTRSGPLREMIEKLGPYTTDGLAGFWGLDIAVMPTGGAEKYHLCPALLMPTQTLKSKPIKVSWQNTCLDLLAGLDSYLKKRPLSLLCWVECFGALYGVLTWLYTAGFSVAKCVKKDYFIDKMAYKQIPFDQQLSYGLGFLRGLALKAFPKIIIICGHGSHSLNNIFAAKLQCGACGNYRGIENARLMAQILNDKQVQNSLNKNHGFDLSQTLFIAAEHNTVTDAVTFDEDFSALATCDLMQKIRADFKRAQHINILNRLSRLGCGSSYHWAQTRPEWGLAGHHALIIGPSWWALQEGRQGKVFLHSYDFSTDINSQQLNRIFKGPVNVAYLLNMQYFFPSFDKGLFSSGNKMLHQLSMMQMPVLGNGSDLMLGLPIQSIAFSKNDPYHQAVRLLVIVYAQLEQLIAVLSQDKGLTQKFQNRWIFLKIYDPIRKKWFDYENLCQHLGAKNEILVEALS